VTGVIAPGRILLKIAACRMPNAEEIAMARNVALIGLVIGALLGSIDTSGRGTVAASANREARMAQSVFATRYCYDQYRRSDDVLRCLRAHAL
jgi:hypothetical protein